MLIRMFFIGIICTLVSCHGGRTPDPVSQDTVVAALDNQPTSSFDFSSRSNYDLIDNLYNDLAEKDSKLKKLEEDIDRLERSKTDSTEAFDKYDERNHAFFSSANSHIDAIKDSLVRDRMKALIAANRSAYTALTARQNELMKLIEARGITLSDLHQVLKITRTLPLMERYQKRSLPGTWSLEGFIRQQEGVVKEAEGLSE